MGQYVNEASTYMSRTSSIIDKLESVKTNMKQAVANFDDNPSNDVLTVNTIDVSANIIKAIESIINDLNNSSLSIMSEAKKIDKRIEMEELAKKQQEEKLKIALLDEERFKI